MSESGSVWDDPRVVEGMERLLARRRGAVDAGERPIGWKLAFGPAPVREKLGISGPVVGYLTDATVLTAGQKVSLGGWDQPMLEAEIAIRMDADLEPGADAEVAARAVGQLGPAIEVADVDRPGEQLAEVLAGNIYHRGVLFGREVAPEVAGSDRLAVEIVRDGERVAEVHDAEAAVGAVGELVAHVGAYLRAFGESLRAGEVIISGSTVPPMSVAPGERYGYALHPIGELTIEFAT